MRKKSKLFAVLQLMMNTTICLQALTRLDQVEVQLNTMDLPRNSAELADRHSQLSNAIMEISSPPLRDGRILLERVSRDDRGADGIRRLVSIPFYYNHHFCLQFCPVVLFNVVLGAREG